MPDLIADACEFAQHAVPAGTPLTTAQSLSRMRAMRPTCDPRIPNCNATVYIDMFFDGTGNNRDADYVKLAPAKRRHTNVVRLYHAYPDGLKVGADGYYRFYVPGVGTPFPELRDEGGTYGAGFARMGEARIVWGLIKVLNAVHDHVLKDDLIQDAQASQIARAMGGFTTLEFNRQAVLRQTWQPRLQEALRFMSPKVTRIVIDVFGFSRGAAQARTWVNWLYGICERQGEQDRPNAVYRFAGIELQVRFMGLFDTVASVGWAGLQAGALLDANGHMSWAKNSLQIHPHVARCAHYVAAHEVRACFPSDSVRVEGRYPANAREWVYPGVHSDVGGGYAPGAQGKTDALARVPGYAMYREAMAHGVPFFDEHVLKSRYSEYYADLIPTPETIGSFNTYLTDSRATLATVEQHHRQHATLYLRYRVMAGTGYARRAFVDRAVAEGDMQTNERAQLIKTQTDLLGSLRHAYDVARDDPRLPRMDLAYRHLVLALQARSRGLVRSWDKPQPPLHLRELNWALAHWRERLAALRKVELMADVPDVDLASLLDALAETSAQGLTPANLDRFFDGYVHDSMASFIGMNMDEFDKMYVVGNGLGLLKWRRYFFGDREDAFAREQAKAENQRRKQQADARSAQVSA